MMFEHMGRNHEEQGRIDLFVDSVGKYLSAEVIHSLIRDGFFVKPASINYHGKHEGALFDHSNEVAKTLVDMTEKMGLRWQNERSPYIVGMFHDLCKLGNYTCSENTDSWVYNEQDVMPGHGEKSVIYAQRLIDLTDEELLCIRWHMGAFDNKENWDYYTRACRKYPNVLFTHTADMIASQIKGV